MESVNLVYSVFLFVLSVNTVLGALENENVLLDETNDELSWNNYSPGKKHYIILGLNSF